MLEAAAFNGSNSRIKLFGGAFSRLAALGSGYENSFEWLADFRFDGMAPGQTTQILFASDAFSLTLVTSANEVRLVATVAGQISVSYPPESGDPIERGRWYRMRWGASKVEGAHFLQVQKWNVRNGGYFPGLNAADCAFRPWAANLPAPGDVWIGHDGSTHSETYFRGRLDNVSLITYQYYTKTTLCTLQQ